MKFKSAVDNWYYLLIVGVSTFILVILLPPTLAGHLSFPYTFTIVLVTAGLPVWLLFTTTYEVITGKDRLLIIRSGPFTWKIPVDEITSAKASRNMISSPALSLDRIAIYYSKDKRVLVSPRDKTGFLLAIKQQDNQGSNN